MVAVPGREQDSPAPSEFLARAISVVGKGLHGQFFRRMKIRDGQVSAVAKRGL